MNFLPPELLNDIFYHLKNDQKSLYGIFIVSKKFHHIILPLIYYRPKLINIGSFRKFLQIPQSSGSLVREIDLSLLGPNRRLEITDQDIISLVTLCPYLTFLDINFCNQLHDVSLIYIANNLGSHLTTLNVSQCPNFTDNGFIKLARCCKVLKSLDFSYTDITDSALSEIAVTCPAIKWLNLKYCELVTDLSLDDLRKWCKELKFLALEGCFGVMREVNGGGNGVVGIGMGVDVLNIIGIGLI
ncbi:84_t:CDS:2 [Entrophospora sp. SA101]|nr:84_t:CDS:2 [Entrophospora sp. SA101]CAJ0847392.1 3610_t:CDS:2 [Entrophospora sp. SA101]